MILDSFPDTETFYRDYWHKKPFIVRGYIPLAVFDDFIDAQTLAGLSLEDGIKSRLILNDENGETWQCEHGPLSEETFKDLGEKNWSILVQNIEQYHQETGDLLGYFDFSPRWLVDDIMVSYSTIGGSVGPHKDSYHTFLVQGTGERTWKISDHEVTDDTYAENGDIRILANGFNGGEYKVECGDVIYMPPHFGHEGITTKNAMTFSVGFQGPKLSEILSEYAYFLEENEDHNTRYLGKGLTSEDSKFTLSQQTTAAIQTNITHAITANHFQDWLVGSFSTPTHVNLHDDAQSPLSIDDISALLKQGHGFIRPEHIKIVISENYDGYVLSALAETITVDKGHALIIDRLNNNAPLTAIHIKNEQSLSLATMFYNMGILQIAPSL